ncbi:hypothetical protein NG726_38540, partial [Pseudomonas sp. MOB-449]|nr:hypothetical protein [Pseudomonas sp. MOB-449]
MKVSTRILNKNQKTFPGGMNIPETNVRMGSQFEHCMASARKGLDPKLMNENLTSGGLKKTEQTATD